MPGSPGRGWGSCVDEKDQETKAQGVWTRQHSLTPLVDEFSWHSPVLKQRIFSSHHHFLRNLAKFPWASSFMHGSQKWAGRERKKQSDTSYRDSRIWQKTYYTAHLLILRLSITHWNKNVLWPEFITIINTYVFIQTKQCFFIQLTGNHFLSLDHHQAIMT